MTRHSFCKILLTAALFLGLGQPFSDTAYADSIAESLAPRMAKLSHIDGEFSQQRFIAVLSVPLQSSGVFSYDREQGVTWQTLKPIASLVKIDPKQGVLTGQSEQDLQAVTSSQVVGDIFIGLFSGDLTRLTGMFHATEQSTANGWELLLEPRDPQVAEHIASIQVRGGEHVETIVLREGNGDRSEISLHVTAAR
jgi:hypothetical protein